MKKFTIPFLTIIITCLLFILYCKGPTKHKEETSFEIASKDINLYKQFYSELANIPPSWLNCFKFHGLNWNPKTKQLVEKSEEEIACDNHIVPAFALALRFSDYTGFEIESYCDDENTIVLPINGSIICRYDMFQEQDGNIAGTLYVRCGDTIQNQCKIEKFDQFSCLNIE